MAEIKKTRFTVTVPVEKYNEKGKTVWHGELTLNSMGNLHVSVSHPTGRWATDRTEHYFMSPEAKAALLEYLLNHK